MDKNGKIIINPQFDSASKFSDGLTWVMIGNKIGYIDKTGKYVINPQFECEGSADFDEGIAVMSSQAIDRQGKSIWKAAKPATCDEEGG